MFGELPKLFDRDFAIAYFLPSAAFMAVTYLILARLFGLSPVLLRLSADAFLADLAAFGLLSLLGGIILLLANRGVVRLLEGYWPFGLSRRANWLGLWRFHRLRKKSLESDQDFDEHDASGVPIPRHLQNERNKIKLLEASRFPNDENLVLPTSFGNTFRAFETYSSAMYGIDAIPGWFRLLAVVPKEYRGLMDSARARVDFWVNVSFLSLLIIVEFYLGASFSGRISLSALFSPRGQWPWIPGLALLVFWMAYTFARKAAEQWGNWVKSAFDLYLPDLRTKLKFAPAASKEEEREMWTAFNIAVLTNDSQSMPDKIPKETDQPPSIETLYMELRKLNEQEKLLLLEAVVRTKKREQE